MKKVMILPYVIKAGVPHFFVGKRPKSLVPDYIKTNQLWQFPTGKVGDNIKGEQPTKAALRELEEELGIKSFKNFINNDYSFSWKRQGEATPIKEYVFSVEIEDKDISLDKREFEKYSLLKEKDACDKLFFSSHKKFLGLIASDIKKGNYAKIIVLSGPGGSGKETVIEAVCKKTNIQRAKTVTTRKQNKDENSSGRIFVDENKFLQMRTRGDFIETNHFKENYYGSLRSEVESRIISGNNVIIEVDLNGLIAMEEKYSNVVSVFIKVDLESLMNRMIKRGRDSREEIQTRMNISRQELEKANICDYIISNDEGMLEKTVQEVIKIIKKEKGTI